MSTTTARTFIITTATGVLKELGWMTMFSRWILQACTDVQVEAQPAACKDL